ncbi:class I SAM-dependent methyltransferase [Pseudoalteromonas sp. MMG013]|uniref:class I SAM-dependent methyltransferase n=1 Tax=Pseudoalteromonas sp. MMG013 TaxID=2822687 RepID=UPI001B367AE2|nr:class I SAM-dependent methyltransferase [Pseudoalteromonas sp. MMG013]MBQ4861090.1 class I SAM-dependent methyltransferase [Pseudoalteromonas sp. MMG013]
MTVKSTGKAQPCPVEKAGSLDTWYRRILQNPEKVIQPYVYAGMQVMDIGCGPGYFTLPLATRVGNSGRVVAVDMQQGMLDIVQQKVQLSNEPRSNIECILCSEDSLGISGEFDFILAFYMLHEVPDIEGFLSELYALLKSGGGVLIGEPAFFGISFSHFASTITVCEKLGFVVEPVHGIFMTKAIYLKKL